MLIRRYLSYSVMSVTSDTQSLDFEISPSPSRQLRNRDAESSGRDSVPLPEVVRTLPIEDAVEAAGFGLFQVRVMIACGLCWMADAMEMMLLSFLLVELKAEWNLTSWQESSIVSVVFVGMFFGAYLWGYLSDRRGRRFGYFATAAFTGVFGLASAFAPNVWVMLVFRGITGLGLGGSPVAFSLFTEFLPMKQRGKCLLLFEFFWTLGTLAEAGLAWAILPSIGWRWLLAITSIPLFLLLAAWPILPESPRFLLISGRHEEARVLMEKAAAMNGKVLPPGRLFVGGGVVERGRALDLFAPGLRRSTVCLFLLWFINTFVYYGLIILTPDFFSTGSGGPETINYTFIFITTMAEAPGLLLGGLLVDPLGRKKTQLLLFIGTGASVFLLGLKSQVPIGVATAFMVAARLFINGVFCVTYAYTPEVFPTAIRTLATGACSAMSRIAGFLTPYLANAEINFWFIVSVYGSMCLVAAGLTFFLPFETKQMRLKDSVSDMNAELDGQTEALPVTVRPGSRLRSPQENGETEILLSEAGNDTDES